MPPSVSLGGFGGGPLRSLRRVFSIRPVARRASYPGVFASVCSGLAPAWACSVCFFASGFLVEQIDLLLHDSCCQITGGEFRSDSCFRQLLPEIFVHRRNGDSSGYTDTPR